LLSFIEDILDKVEDCQSVADWTEDRVAVRCEDEVSLLVNSSTKVGELRRKDRDEIVESVIRVVPLLRSKKIGKGGYYVYMFVVVGHALKSDFIMICFV
jgi:hypothetical protein